LTGKDFSQLEVLNGVDWPASRTRWAREDQDCVELTRRPKRCYAWLRRRYGEIVTIYAGGGPFVLALTSDGARELLSRDPDCYEAFNRGAFAGMTGAGSLWVMDGARHREERQLLAPRLNAECARGFGSAILDIALAHMRTWRPGSAMRADHAMLDISREVILYVLFGIRRGAIIDEAARKLEARSLPRIRCLRSKPGCRRGGSRRGGATSVRKQNSRGS
jgi:cytochrome P450